MVTDGWTDPFAIDNPDGAGAVVLVVDHASNSLPAAYGDLGLDETARTAHIAWDPGALGVARALSARLDAPLIRGTVSRLVLDLNRDPQSPTLIPAVSETTVIPGNRDLDPAERARRIAAIHTPYHAALSAMIDRQTARVNGPVAVVAVHSFTPVFKGVARPMQVGILFGRDERLGRAMLAALAGEPGLVAAANRPYSPADGVYWTLEHHALARGLPNVMIEIRNDELPDAAAEQAWAARLADAIIASRTDGAAGRGGG